MKRDFDLIRSLLLKIERNQTDHPVWQLDVDGISQQAVIYHIWLLKDAGLIVADVDEVSDGTLDSFIIYCLTWAGHEFLDAVRDEEIWQNIRNRLYQKLSGVPFDVVKSVALEMARRAVG